MNKKVEISICIPVHKGSGVLPETLNSIFHQNFQSYEIIIVDDNDPLDTLEINKTKKLLTPYKNKILYYKNIPNKGTQKSFQHAVSLARGGIIFLLCQDDILLDGALQKTFDAFSDESVGLVTRPYYWFDDNIHQPIRDERPISKYKNVVFSLFDGKKKFTYFLNSIGQASGLAIRKNMLRTPFHKDIFPGHIYPILEICKVCMCVFLKDYTVAVRYGSSQTRLFSSIYETSPALSWIHMFHAVYRADKYKRLREMGIAHITSHYEGLVQLKNYARPGILEREVWILIRYRWQNVYNVRFWFFVLLTIFTPRIFLRRMNDWYKKKILSRTISVS